MLAILCSGQGRQHADMFALTANVPAAADIFDCATTLFGKDPREWVKTASPEEMHENRAGQILCCLQALAAVAALPELSAGPLLVAGYSVGELASWGVAGRMEMKAVLHLACRRAEMMDACSEPGDGLLSVRGLSRAVIDTLCEQHHTAIAIINPGGGFIVGGTDGALTGFADQAMKLSATRVVRIPVAVASHTPLLLKAAVEFAELLTHAEVRNLGDDRRLISGVDGSSVSNASEGLEKLSRQIAQTVRWADCLETCVESQASVFLELGPGTALAEMVGNAYPNISARSLDDFKTLEGVRNWIANHVAV